MSSLDRDLAFGGFAYLLVDNLELPDEDCIDLSLLSVVIEPTPFLDGRDFSSVGQIPIKNLCSQTIIIDSVKIIQTASEFEYLGNQSFQIDPNQTKNSTIRYTPSEVGISNCRIRYYFFKDSVDAFVNASAFQAEPEISFVSFRLEANPPVAKIGEDVFIELKIQELNNVPLDTELEFDVEILLNNSLLNDLEDPNGYDFTTGASNSIIEERIKFKEEEMQFSWRMKVLLSETDTSDLSIVNVYNYNTNRVQAVELIDGRFDAAISEIGGKRLIRRNLGFVASNPYPNPSNGQIKLDIDFLEESIFSIEIISIDGKGLIKKNYGDYQKGKSFDIDISSLKSGSYQMILKTEDDQKIQNISVIK